MKSKLMEFIELLKEIKDFLSSKLKKSRRLTAINSAIAGFILFLFSFGFELKILDLQITISSYSEIGKYLIIYSSLTLFWMSIYLIKKPYITPEIKTLRCHYCNSLMSTAELICQNCSSTSKKSFINRNFTALLQRAINRRVYKALVELNILNIFKNIKMRIH